MPVSSRSVCVFFLPRRSRLTRCSRAWSSEVSSSDFIWDDFLAEVCSPACPPFEPGPKLIPERLREVGLRLVLAEDHVQRSEERRVGEECRSRWSPYH